MFGFLHCADILTKYKQDNLQKLRYTKAELESDTQLQVNVTKRGRTYQLRKDGSKTRVKQYVVALRAAEEWADEKLSGDAIRGYACSVLSGR
jgi:hypothetical protein